MNPFATRLARSLDGPVAHEWPSAVAASRHEQGTPPSSAGDPAARQMGQ